MLIKNIKVSGLLSFGPRGIDLPMERLNVLIGPNGCGKSNFVEVLNLLRHAPIRLDAPVMTGGGIRDWLWKAERDSDEPQTASLEFLISPDREFMENGIRHHLQLAAAGDEVRVEAESIAYEKPFRGESEAHNFYELRNDRARLPEREIAGSKLDSRASILSQLKDPDRYLVFERMQQAYLGIQIYRDWTFGPGATMRSSQIPNGPVDAVYKDGKNIVSVIASMSRGRMNDLIERLRDLYSEIVNLRLAPSGGGALRLFVEEQGGMEIPAERLSDGTLRFLYLLVVLLAPDPPRLIAIEEPELGFHPDVIPKVADLLVDAASRTQLVVTTHSRMLVDALGDKPERVVVCGKENGETVMERLSSDDLDEWLRDYTLGDLWSRGEIGGNRW